MVKRLMSFKTENGEELSPKTKLWIAKALAGAVMADDFVHTNEKIHIEKMFDEFQGNSSALMELRTILKGNTPPDLEPISMSSKLAERVLRTVMEICACDHELVPEEIRYINHVGMSLNISVLRVHKLIHSMVRHVKIEFFNELLKALNEGQRRWLATVVLKSIYADGKIDKNEIIYFNDIYELLDGDQKLIENLKQDVRHVPLEELPVVQFDHELATQVLRYLVEITVSDDDLDERELVIVQHVARQLSYPQDELKNLIRSVVSVRVFMIASAELVR